MRYLYLLLALFLFGCQDPEPYHAKTACAMSCAERGGEFLLLTQEGYCYCAWYDGGAD